MNAPTLAVCVFKTSPRIIKSKRYRARCVSCDVDVSGWDHTQADSNFYRHIAIPPPPPDVLAAPLTYATMVTYPHYYLNGRGRQIAAVTDCGHGYLLTDSCAVCGTDD